MQNPQHSQVLSKSPLLGKRQRSDDEEPQELGGFGWEYESQSQIRVEEEIKRIEKEKEEKLTEITIKKSEELINATEEAAVKIKQLRDMFKAEIENIQLASQQQIEIINKDSREKEDQISQECDLKIFNLRSSNPSSLGLSPLLPSLPPLSLPPPPQIESSINFECPEKVPLIEFMKKIKEIVKNKSIKEFFEKSGVYECIEAWHKCIMIKKKNLFLLISEMKVTIV